MELRVPVCQKISPADAPVVMAAMLYPRPGEGRERDRLEACFEVKRLKEIKIEGAPRLFESMMESLAHIDPKLMAQFFTLTAESGQYDSDIEKAAKRAKNAHVAGDLLENLLRGRRHHPDLQVNLRKVISAHAWLTDGIDQTFGRAVKTEEGFRKQWKQFKAASHLYLVLNRLQRSTGDMTKAGHAWADNLFTNLGVAENIRLEAVRQTSFKEEDLWRLPAAIGIKIDEDLVDRLLPPLPQFMLDAIRAVDPVD